MSTPTTQPKPGRSFLASLQASIRNRLTAIVIGSSIIPVLLVSIILGLVTFNQIQTSLTQEAFAKLGAVQAIKTNQITAYLAERQSDLLALRQTAATLRQEAVSKLTSVSTLKNKEISHLFEGWDRDVRDVAADPGVIAGILDLENGFQALGSAQVRALFLGREELLFAGDSAYSTAHIEQHSFFGGYTAIHEYEDAFMIAPDGDIVYNVHKGESFGANLNSEAYKNTNLATLYQTLRNAPAGKTFITDMGMFDGELAMFIGTPIYNGNVFVGLLAYQVPLSHIDEIMLERTGLGETGETYLIGPDKLFRTSSRFIEGESVLNPAYLVDTFAVNEALGGKSGNDIYFGFRDVQVLAVYAPVNVPDLNWAIVSVVDVEEAFVPRIAGQDKDFFAQYAETYGYYDIFLIDPEGYMFYSVAKESDYHTNMLTGEYKTSNLGELVAEILESKALEFADFAAYAPTGNAPASFLGIPLIGADGEVEMIVATQLALEQISAIMQESTGLGQSGETYLVGSDQLWRSDSRFLTQLGADTTVLNPDFKVDTIASRSALSGESGQQQINDYRGVSVLSAWSPVKITESETSKDENLTWALIAEVDETEALAAVNRIAGVVALVVGLTVLGIGTLAAVVGTRFALGFVNPIISLTTTATKVAEGNLNLSVDVKSEDEIGVLSKAFNSMTAQLRDIIGSLEGRVADRTRNLELAAEVGRSVSQVRNLDEMLRDAAEIIRQRFDLYYVQVYLTNVSRTELLLQAGTGTVGQELLGRAHHLPINTASINGRAAVERRPVIIADTTASATFRPNPLLPNTRSEMAIPLTVGERVVGVLDLQSITPGSLSEESLPAFEALAGQLAIAIQNANLLAETEQARKEVEKQAARLARSNWQEYLDAIHKAENIGFAYENNQIIPLEEVDESKAKGNPISSPITVTGEELGALTIELDQEKLSPQNLDLVNIVARQVGQQLENLRLLESAERFRNEAEVTARRATIEGWKKYIESRSEQHLGYMYNTKEVVPASEETQEPSFTIPVKAGDETVGKLAVMGLETQDSESLDLASAVATRLGAHIESLRLFEETRRGQLELDKRARELASVAEISTVSARELDVAKMLESVVYLTQRKFGLYHAHVFTYDERSRSLVIQACGWKEGDEREGTHGTTTIPIDQEQSLVARAARERKAVIVNDVQSDPGWLPNPLLPDTKSEMAVPLIVGERLLGVLDVQKDFINGFTEEDVNVKTTLATQVATALQNAQSFTQAQQQADREAMLNTISQKIQSATTVEAVLQIAARELGHALGAPLTVAQLGLQDGNNGK